MDNNRFLDMCAELSDKIDRQPMKHTDRDKIIEQCKQYTHDIKRQQEHLEMVHRYIGSADMKISKLQNDVRYMLKFV
jgi:hypothetical protein